MNKRKKRWAALLVGLALMSTVLWQFNRRTANNLLDHATQITSIANIEPQISWLLPPTFFWLSEQEILYYNHTSNGYQVYRKQVRAGRSSPPVSMPVLLPQGGPEMPSPDGKWLVWSKSTGPRKVAHGAVALDRSRTVTWPASGYGDGKWMPDSRHWMLLTYRKQPVVEIYSVDRPGVEVVPLPVPHKTNSVPQILGFTPQGRAIGAMDGTFLYNASRLLSPFPQMIPSHNYPEMQFFEFGLGPHAAPPRLFTIRTMPGVDCGTVQLSPQGDRLVWNVRCRETVPVQSWMELIRAYKPPPPIIQWWVSRLDGSALREIGWFKQEGDADKLNGPQWTPDGKHLSFIYKQALYTIPVE